VDSRINDVVARWPGTAPVFIQLGRLYVDRPGELYPAFPGLTVGDFARYNRVDLEPLLVELNAEAESEAAPWRWPRNGGAAHGAPDLGAFSLALGYTAGYRPQEDAVPERVPVVLVQSTRGPE
jgi:hypothetical protein